ncbi:YdeI/OmpD-associated family protein [Candidatus Uhrbacteria bacterium]|nr:YdeI/OmpD-associated family protein [Candidatus Uhrbacteria bacterium]
MVKETLATGVVHTIPEDLRKGLMASSAVSAAWNSLTPLARNEWICWTLSVKKEETRKEHVERVCKQLLEGKRRPCCWPGCPHRRPNAKKWFK